MAATATALRAPSRQLRSGLLSPDVIDSALVALHKERHELELQRADHEAKHGAGTATFTTAALNRIEFAIAELGGFGS